MTSQIIFPKEATYWILSDGVSYYDGFTPSNCITTVGAGTTVYWIGSNHQEYIQACLDLGITPRNPGDSPLVSIDPASPASFFDQKINELTNKLNEIDKNKLDQINTLSDSIDSINSIISDIDKIKEQSVNEIVENISQISVKQEDISQKLDTLGYVVPGVRISARQARLWLIQNGIDPSLIRDAIDTIEDITLRESIRTEWEYATYVERSYPWLVQLCGVLGLSEEDLDRAFQEAVLI
jgi:hypothetical protein